MRSFYQIPNIETQKTAHFLFTTIGIRLVGGRNEYEGRIEVQYQGQWGTVCDDNFGIDDAHVACRMMGLGRAISYCSNNRDKCSSNGRTFTAGSGEIWLDDLRCTGDEDTLFDCTHPGIGVENCAHSEDVGVVCKGRRNTFNSSFINNIEMN